HRRLLARYCSLGGTNGDEWVLAQQHTTGRQATQGFDRRAPRHPQVRAMLARAMLESTAAARVLARIGRFGA
ncbi:hypothetical protein Dimus_035384, partial [Dionaea muscipula]